MNIEDVDLSDFIVKTPVEYQIFKNNVADTWPVIEQNYDRDKRLMVNFILMMEKVYAENPDVEKIETERSQNTIVEDVRNNLYIHEINFKILNKETQKELDSPAVKELYNYIQDVFAEKAYDEEYENGGKMALAIMENDLCFSELGLTSRNGRFNVYREMAEFNYIHNQDTLNNFVNTLEKGEPVKDSYKVINLLGKDINIKTMGVRDNALELDAYPNITGVLKEGIEAIEYSYAINSIKEAILRNNLDENNVLKISFQAKEPKNYLNYTCKVEDINNKQVEIDVDFALHKRQGFDRSSIEVRSEADINRDLSMKFAGFANSQDLEEKVLRDKETIDHNYMDVNDFINRPRARMKM